MRSTEDQLQEIMKRADLLSEKTKIRRNMLTEAVSCGFCLAAVFLVIHVAPHVKAVSGENEQGIYGSLLLSGPVVGLVLTAVLFFVLGVFVTLLCLHWKQYRSLSSRPSGKEEGSAGDGNDNLC